MNDFHVLYPDKPMQLAWGRPRNISAPRGSSLGRGKGGFCHIYAEFGIKIYSPECTSAFNYGLYGLQLPAHMFKFTWLLIAHTWIQLPTLCKHSYHIRTLLSIHSTLCFTADIRSICLSILGHVFCSGLFLDFVIFVFASDILFVYQLNYCLSLAMFKPSIFGFVICYLPDLIKKHFAQVLPPLPPDRAHVLKTNVHC